MKLNFLAKRVSTIGRWLTTALLCVSAIAFTWQGAFFSSNAAIAAPATNLIAAADAGSEVQGKASKDAGRTKGFVRDTTDKLKKTAKTMLPRSIAQLMMIARSVAKLRKTPLELSAKLIKIRLALRMRSTKRRMQSKALLIISKMRLATRQ